MSSPEEKEDLGVLDFMICFNMTQECVLVSQKDSSILGCFKGHVASRSTAVVLPLCSSLVHT